MQVLIGKNKTTLLIVEIDSAAGTLEIAVPDEGGSVVLSDKLPKGQPFSFVAAHATSGATTELLEVARIMDKRDDPVMSAELTSSHRVDPRMCWLWTRPPVHRETVTGAVFRGSTGCTLLKSYMVVPKGGRITFTIRLTDDCADGNRGGGGGGFGGTFGHWIGAGLATGEPGSGGPAITALPGGIHRWVVDAASGQVRFAGTAHSLARGNGRWLVGRNNSRATLSVTIDSAAGTLEIGLYDGTDRSVRCTRLPRNQAFHLVAGHGTNSAVTEIVGIDTGLQFPLD